MRLLGVDHEYARLKKLKGFPLYCFSEICLFCDDEEGLQVYVVSPTREMITSNGRVETRCMRSPVTPPPITTEIDPITLFPSQQELYDNCIQAYKASFVSMEETYDLPSLYEDLFRIATHPLLIRLHFVLFETKDTTTQTIASTNLSPFFPLPPSPQRQSSAANPISPFTSSSSNKPATHPPSVDSSSSFSSSFTIAVKHLVDGFAEAASRPDVGSETGFRGTSCRGRVQVVDDSQRSRSLLDTAQDLVCSDRRCGKSGAKWSSDGARGEGATHSSTGVCQVEQRMQLNG